MLKCKVTYLRFSFMLILGLLLVFFIVSFDEYYFPAREDQHYVYINVSEAIFVTDREFLSVGLDTSFMKISFHKLNFSDWELLAKFARYLSPAYLRLGGTAADQVLFTVNDTFENKNYGEAGDETHAEKKDLSPEDYLNISGRDWLKFNDFISKSDLKLLLDLNVLLRNGGRWNSQNAEDLLSFCSAHGFRMDFQLGNEPNSFRHVFNVTISGNQLARDFESLREILNTSGTYQDSKLIGPDVTRPKYEAESSLNYLRSFLKSIKHLSAVSWHQYYFDGRTATLEDFIDVNIFNTLSYQIKAVTDIVRQFSRSIPIWLKTSSAYGGGAPGLSNRYVASFLWLDKLGLAAKLGLKVVIRQSFFQGHYSLIDENLYPLPDYWLSLFYKLLVGRHVMDVKFSRHDKSTRLRLYAHCLKNNKYINGSVILFGMNMGNKMEYITPGGLRKRYLVTPLIFTPFNGSLLSKSVLLNGRRLSFHDEEDIFESAFRVPLQNLPLRIPSYSIGFWIFHGEREAACRKE